MRREIVTFVIGAIVFFVVGTIFAYLDELFQSEFTDNKAEARGFWTTVALTAIAIVSIIIIYHIFIERYENSTTTAERQFINIHDTRALELGELSTADVKIGEINVGV